MSIGIGDGIADDTAAIAAAINAAAAAHRPVALIGSAGNTFRVSSQIALREPVHNIIGGGMGNTRLIAAGNFPSVFSVWPSVKQFRLADLSIDQTGTTTQCVNINGRLSGSFPLDFERVQFVGDMARKGGSLVYCGGVLAQFFRCVWSPNSLSLICLQLDMNNENTSVLGCTFLGIGNGIALTKSGSGIGPQGVRIQDSMLACFGADYNIHVGGSSSNTYITDCVLDQATGSAIIVDEGAAAVQIRGGWAGLKAGSEGQTILLDPTASMISVDGMQIYGGEHNILVESNAMQRLDGLRIVNCDLSGASSGALQLDSVNRCSITGNQDYSTIAPSLTTIGTHPAKGTYTIGGNTFIDTVLDPASVYK